MTSAVAAAAERQKKAIEDEAKEMQRQREAMMKGEKTGHAGPDVRPSASAQPQAKRVRTDEEDKASKAAEEVEAARREALLNRPDWHKKVKSAQYWYYRDQMFTPQGPFYPGQLRDWFSQGYFNENTEVAPSFQGEMPQKYARVVEAFKHPLSETAFVPGEGIANYPPEEQVQEVKKEVTKEQLIRSLMEATPGQEFQKSAISFN